MLHDILSSSPQFIVSFLAGLSLVVFVHEFGHYWVARRCGIKIEAFSIGFGHEIFGWTDGHGTRWKVCWLPLGGYVKMFGDSDPASTPGENAKTMTDDEKRVAFYHQRVAKRMAVVMAGPAFNYLFAIVVLSALFTVQGIHYAAPIVSSVIENSAAAKAGLVKGDVVTVVDGTQIERFNDIQRIVTLNAGTPIAVEVKRDGQPKDFTMTPDVVTITDRFGGEHTIGRIGITSDDLIYKKVSPPMAVYQALLAAWNLTSDTMRAIGQIIIGSRSVSELGGPIAVAKLLGGAAQDGFGSWINLLALFSVNLGFFNLLPIPLLDGGHLAFYIVEWLRGKPVHEKIQNAGMRVGLAFVFSLFALTTWNDLHLGKILSGLMPH